jgi:hypothetical protein
MDGDGETAVSKGEVTRNATLDERWSMGATRGRGGARATLMPKHRGESGWRCLSLSGRKGEKGVGRSGGVCARARGRVADNTQRRRGWGAVGRAGEAPWGGVRYSAVLAALGECGLARGEGKWVGPRETVSGGGGKLI